MKPSSSPKPHLSEDGNWTTCSSVPQHFFCLWYFFPYFVSLKWTTMSCYTMGRMLEVSSSHQFPYSRVFSCSRLSVIGYKWGWISTVLTYFGKVLGVFGTLRYSAFMQVHYKIGYLVQVWNSDYKTLNCYRHSNISHPTIHTHEASSSEKGSVPTKTKAPVYSFSSSSSFYFQALIHTTLCHLS